MSAIVENEPNRQKAQPWLVYCSVIIVALTFILRFYHCREIPAEVACEIDAASRMVAGQKLYVDFYSDQLPLIIIWRLLTIGLADFLHILLSSSQNLPDQVSNQVCDWRTLGLASATITNLLSLVSFGQLYIILSRYGAKIFTADQKWLFLLAFALANLAMGFEYGQQQHIFILLALPFLLLRYLTWQGVTLPAFWQIGTAFQAAFGGAFSLFYIVAIAVFELVEMLARRLYRPLLTIGPLAFLILSALFWSQFFILSKAQSAAYSGWILPLKFSALTHDNYSFYGSYVTPERKELLYASVMALIVAFGLQLRLPVLRSIAAMTIYGLVVFMTCVLGLSCDAIILTFFMCLLIVIEFYSLVLYAVRTYPRLFRLNIGPPAAGSWTNRRQTPIAIICAIAILLGVSCLFINESAQRRLAKTAATRLAGQAGDAPDLQAVIEQFSGRCDQLIILNGNLRPTYPLITLTERLNCGYLLDSTPLGTLANIRGRHYWQADRGTSRENCQREESELYKRLGDDIIRLRPRLICVQGGVIDEALHLYKIDALIGEKYKRICEAQYHSDRLGSREISEPNYNYWVYQLK